MKKLCVFDEELERWVELYTVEYIHPSISEMYGSNIKIVALNDKGEKYFPDRVVSPIFRWIDLD